MYRTNVHDRTLLSAVGAALDRLQHFIEQRDEASVGWSAAVVVKLLAHPTAPIYRRVAPEQWRETLERWDALRAQVAGPTISALTTMSEVVEHFANVDLIEAARRAEELAATAAEPTLVPDGSPN